MKKHYLPLVSGLLLAISTQVAIADDSSNSSTATDVVTTNSDNSSTMNIMNILTKLKEQGYPVIYKVEIDKGVISVKGLNLQGRDAKMKFDSQGNLIEPTGAKQPQPGISLIDAVRKALDAGYKNVFYIDTEDEDYKIKAYGKDGKEVTVKVDSVNGNLAEDK